jgi:hypothetical protein
MIGNNMVIDNELFVSKLETIWLAETYLYGVNQPSWLLELDKWNFSIHFEVETFDEVYKSM